MNSLRSAGAGAAIAVLTLLPLTAAFADEGSTPTPQASIPFVNYGAIENWQADRDKGLWIQDAHRKWYYATLMAPCTGLGFATAIGFDTRPMDTFDRWSTVIVPGWGRCPVQSFTTSDGPPNAKAAAANTKAATEKAG